MKAPRPLLSPPQPPAMRGLRLAATVSRERLREGSSLSNRNFDSTTAGVCVTVKHGLRKAVLRGGEARSPRHTGPRYVSLLQPLGVSGQPLLRALKHPFGASRHLPSFSCIANILSVSPLNPAGAVAFAGTPQAN
jgi:hypothetical protein